MGNFVDASYGVHEVVACDLNEDEENHMGDFEPPPVLEPDLGKRWNTRAGSLIRARIPVSYTDWRLVHSEFKDKVWNALMAAQKKEKVQLQVGEAKATHLDFDNDELTEVLGADKKSRTRGISSNLSKKQLKRTSIAKVMLAQARSSSNSEFKGEMSEMKSSIARVEGVLMDYGPMAHPDDHILISRLGFYSLSNLLFKLSIQWKEG
ncbi:hypothetical protein IFM89_033239 [Coptis chinensis]|uniref:Uncharacterized protein n=1 Tax=Coptis chinensis TaxID=261450 RepID=A0A835IWG1_9MAGN|nr:hypothetical protein IFM89_033239 [Coptis chinensis]